MRRHTYLVFALILALSASITTVFTPSSLPTVPIAHAVNRTISLEGIFSAWNNSLPSGPNPTITVNQGDIITISLTSGDGGTHMFALDVDKDGTNGKFTGMCSTGDKCSLTFTPSTPTSVMIDTSTLSGTYTYFCTFHTMMVGSFVVVGGSVGGSSLPMNSPAMIGIYLIIAGSAAVIISVAIVLRTRRKNPASTA